VKTSLRFSWTLVTQVVLVLLGLALLARGGFYVLTIVKPAQWIPTAIWLGAGIVIHDAFIAPVTLALGRVLRPGAALRFAWLAGGTVVLLSIPLLEGAKVRRNSTVIPGDPATNLLVSLGLVAIGTLIALGLRFAASRRTAPPT
jgi:hypothetical protein